MKRIIILVTTLVLAVVVYSVLSWKTTDSKDGIHFFTGTWEQALQKAQQERKPIFLDIYATWCGPCKMLKRKTFNSKEAGDYFNANYINMSFDGENGEGQMLADKYHITGYPTLIILDKDGALVDKQTGYMSAGELIKYGKQSMRK